MQPSTPPNQKRSVCMNYFISTCSRHVYLVLRNGHLLGLDSVSFKLDPFTTRFRNRLTRSDRLL